MARNLHEKQRQDLAKAVGFWCHDSHHNSELDDKTDIPCSVTSTQRLLITRISKREFLVLKKLHWIIHKSLFGEAAAKSDWELSGVVN